MDHLLSPHAVSQAAWDGSLPVPVRHGGLCLDLFGDDRYEASRGRPREHFKVRLFTPGTLLPCRGGGSAQDCGDGNPAGQRLSMGQ